METILADMVLKHRGGNHKEDTYKTAFCLDLHNPVLLW
jgi:hypothetical protein